MSSQTTFCSLRCGQHSSVELVVTYVFVLMQRTEQTAPPIIREASHGAIKPGDWSAFD
jgi:hypothetical protein